MQKLLSIADFLLHLYQHIFKYQLHTIHHFISQDQEFTVAYFLYNWDFSRCSWQQIGLSLGFFFVDFPISHLFNLFITLKSFWGNCNKISHITLQSKLESMGLPLIFLMGIIYLIPNLEFRWRINKLLASACGFGKATGRKSKDTIDFILSVLQLTHFFFHLFSLFFFFF